jgi:hypothetical protein
MSKKPYLNDINDYTVFFFLEYIYNCKNMPVTTEAMLALKVRIIYHVQCIRDENYFSLASKSRHLHWGLIILPYMHA